MDCPDCQAKLTVSFYEGAHIHFCIQCHGSLVGASELRTILERHEEEVSRDGGIPDRGQSSGFGSIRTNWKTSSFSLKWVIHTIAECTQH